LEQGATRNYEPWRAEDASQAEAVAKREEEEMGNAMKVTDSTATLCPQSKHYRELRLLEAQGSPLSDTG
jgi:hypothetical protein